MKEGGRASQQPAPLLTGRECPICGKPATKESDPFCSKRCANIDLNRWLKGSYVIPARAEDDDADDGTDAKG